jgi:predicted NBD/HSP70 family sugar kinase
MWGKVFLIREVEKELAKNKSILKKINPIKIKLCLENDAAAAVLAESWIASMAKVHKRVSSSDLNLQKNFSRKSKQSATQSAKNIISVTLGTGLGVGVIANGKLVRSGQNLHPEAGHIIISYNEKEWLCGCGNFGCAEAFLSGVNWTNHLAKKWNEPKLTSEQLVIRARKGDQKVLAEFDLYAERLAAFFTSLIVLFSPQKIIISGGFSHAAELFLPKCETKLIDLLRHRRVGVDLLPAIECSKHPDDMGVLGAAYVALMFQK